MANVFDCPEMDYFMNESKSDIVFVVNTQRIPALMQTLSLKSKVFRALFSDDIKESKELKVKEIVVEDTTFEAFKTLIRFLYCNRLVIKDDNDLELIEEVLKLSVRYEVYGLREEAVHMLCDISSAITYSRSLSVGQQWDRMKTIQRIDFEYGIDRLKNRVFGFIDHNFEYFVNKDMNELLELNQLTDNHIFRAMADKYRRVNRRYHQMKSRLSLVRKFKCGVCGIINLVDSVTYSTQCKKCLNHFIP